MIIDNVDCFTTILEYLKKIKILCLHVNDMV